MEEAASKVGHAVVSQTAASPGAYGQCKLGGRGTIQYLVFRTQVLHGLQERKAAAQARPGEAPPAAEYTPPQWSGPPPP